MSLLRDLLTDFEKGARLSESASRVCSVADEAHDHLVLQRPIIRRRHNLLATAGRSQAAFRHQSAPREQLVQPRRAGEPPSPPSSLARRSPRPSEPSPERRPSAQAPLNRRDDLNLIRRVGRRRRVCLTLAKWGPSPVQVGAISGAASEVWGRSTRNPSAGVPGISGRIKPHRRSTELVSSAAEAAMIIEMPPIPQIALIIGCPSLHFGYFSG